MSSSTRCDAVSVCLLSYTRIAIILVLVFVLFTKIALRDMTWLQPNRKITILDKLAVNTHTAEVLAGVTLSVNAFEFWHARGTSRLARLVKDLTCAAASQTYVERIFSACGLLYSGRRRAMFRCLEMSVCIKLGQCWKKRLAHGNRL